MGQKKIEPGDRVKVKGKTGYYTAREAIVKDDEIVGWSVWRDRNHYIRLADLTVR